MGWRARFAVGAVLVLGSIAGVGGCGSDPPPAPQTPPAPKPEPAPEPPPVPPPPPKCESLEEKCAATEATRARVAGTDLTFAPVVGWSYAQENDATVVVQAGAEDSALALRGHDGGDAKAFAAQRDAAIEALAKKLGLTLPKKKPNWLKPGGTRDFQGGKANLWEQADAARGARKGWVLLLSASLGDGKGLAGLAFVPNDDPSRAQDGIMKAILSLEATTP